MILIVQWNRVSKKKLEFRGWDYLSFQWMDRKWVGATEGDKKLGGSVLCSNVIGGWNQWNYFRWLLVYYIFECTTRHRIHCATTCVFSFTHSINGWKKIVVWCRLVRCRMRGVFFFWGGFRVKSNMDKKAFCITKC